MSAFDPQLTPQLAAHVRLRLDPITNEPVLLFPEGLLVLNATAHEIVRRCDGKTTLAQLLEQLAAEFDAPADVLRDDVWENLEALRRRNLLLFAP